MSSSTLVTFEQVQNFKSWCEFDTEFGREVPLTVAARDHLNSKDGDDCRPA